MTRCWEYLPNIWPFTTIWFGPKQAEFSKVGSKFLPNTNVTLKKLPNIFNIFPKWWNFGKSGHTVTNNPSNVGRCKTTMLTLWVDLHWILKDVNEWCRFPPNWVIKLKIFSFKMPGAKDLSKNFQFYFLKTLNRCSSNA